MVAPNSAFLQQTIDLTQQDGFLVQVTEGVNVQTGLVTWTFTTIDPATGEIPTNPSLGFLPPDNSSGAGEGFVSYTILPKSSDPTGTVINAQATVPSLDTQPPIEHTANLQHDRRRNRPDEHRRGGFPPEEPSPAIQRRLVRGGFRQRIGHLPHSRFSSRTMAGRSPPG